MCAYDDNKNELNLGCNNIIIIKVWLFNFKVTLKTNNTSATCYILRQWIPQRQSLGVEWVLVSRSLGTWYSNSDGINTPAHFWPENEVGFLGTGGGETDLSISQSWGVGGSSSKSQSFGSTSGVTVTLKPHQNVKSVLSATRGVMKIRIQSKHLFASLPQHINSLAKGIYISPPPLLELAEVLCRQFGNCPNRTKGSIATCTWNENEHEANTKKLLTKQNLLPHQTSVIVQQSTYHLLSCVVVRFSY